jgi:hypothetical protein
MTFTVDPTEVQIFSHRMDWLYGEVGYAESYVAVHGSFSTHQAGIIGVLLQEHAKIMADLTGVMNHLETLTWRCKESLTEIAREYRETDEQSAAAIDAALSASPRPIVFEG